VRKRRVLIRVPYHFGIGCIDPSMITISEKFAKNGMSFLLGISRKGNVQNFDGRQMRFHNTSVWWWILLIFFVFF